jgi:hypothetical protein
MSTEAFIRRLAENAPPVRPLAQPYRRAATWLALSIGYVAVVALIVATVTQRDLSSNLADPIFILEESAALITGVAAAVAAFATTIPGRNSKWMLLPLPSFAIWLASLGPGCIREWNLFGWQALPLSHNVWCFPFIILCGAVPAAVMAVMLRRGAPITPHLTAALGGLAAAGLGNAGVRLVHPEDVTVMLLVWHMGGVMALSALAASAGRYLLNWRSIISPSENIAR